MTELNNNFKLDTTEFVGYMKGWREGTEKSMDEIKQDLKDIKRSLGAVKLKVAVIGGTVSLAVTVLCLLLKKLIGL